MNTDVPSDDQLNAPAHAHPQEATPFHQPLEEEEIRAARAGLPTGSREEGPSQQEG